MEIKLLRITEGDTFTEGRLYIDDKFECYTVEDKDRHLEDGENEKVYGKTAIPRGTYPLTISFSNAFKRNLIAIQDVPMFTGIRIHSGNSSEDSEGCIIVGSVNKSDDDDWVGRSKVAYQKLHEKVWAAMEDNQSIEIEII